VSRLALAALAFSLAGAAATAGAQVPRPFALQTWEPTAPGDPFFAVPGTGVPTHLTPSAGLALSWAAAPLLLRSDGDPVPGGRIVHRQFWGYLQGGLGFAGKILFDASLPAALYQSGSRPLPDLPQVVSTGMGDLRLGARVPLPPFGPLATAAAFDLWLPTGVRDAFASDGAARVGLKASASGRLGRIEYGAALGLLWRDGRDLLVTRTGSGFTWSAGAAWCQGAWRVGPEIYGRYQFEGSATSPAEILLGGRWARGSLETGLALGSQLNDAPGAAPFRLLATVGWRPVAASPAEPPPPAAPTPEPAPPEPAPPAAPPPAAPPPPEPPEPADRDGDGVADDLDACPDEKGLTEGEAGRRGCPPPPAPPPAPPPPEPPAAPLVKLTAEKIEILQSVQFETDRDVIRPESVPVLQAVAAVFSGHPELKRVRIEGHTDSQGGVQHNTTLSDKRARSVKRWLVEQGGIDAGRLEPVGYGPTRPIDTNDTKEGRARNRRVEFRILAE